ncbi:MAG TPA: hypothetical protein VJ872_19780 [Nocardioides sp.]|nr:hypothetical protein [Nocardioides sp.]
MSTPAHRVIDLRPHALARRASNQRELLVSRRRRVAPGHQRPLTIVTEVLDRADGVRPRDLDAWERLLDLVADRDGTHAMPATAAAANLFALAAFDDVLDHEALADLADLLGHDHLARIQHGHSALLDTHRALPLTTRAIRRMLAPQLRSRLIADGCSLTTASGVAATSLRGGHALLTQGLDPRWSVPLIDAPEEVVDIVRHGTVAEWRHHMALLVADPWSAYSTRLVHLAARTGDEHTATLVAAIVGLCREQTTRNGVGAPFRVFGDPLVLEGSTGAPAGVPARHLGGVTQHG